MSELPKGSSEFEQEPTPHVLEYDPSINDVWCFNCNTISDWCVQLNDFGQGEADDEI